VNGKYFTPLKKGASFYAKDGGVLRLTKNVFGWPSFPSTTKHLKTLKTFDEKYFTLKQMKPFFFLLLLVLFYFFFFIFFMNVETNEALIRRKGKTHL
jgi:hypothetical protein